MKAHAHVPALSAPAQAAIDGYQAHWLRVCRHGDTHTALVDPNDVVAMEAFRALAVVDHDVRLAIVAFRGGRLALSDLLGALTVGERRLDAVVASSLGGGT